MLKRFSSILLCGCAVAGQMLAQEVVVPRETKPGAPERVATTTSEQSSPESAAAAPAKSQVREKKAPSAALTVEQMRQAGALAAEGLENQGRVEQASTARVSNSQTAKGGLVMKENQIGRTSSPRASNPPTTRSESAGPVRPTMIEAQKPEPTVSQPVKAEVRSGQAAAPQSANGALRKNEPIASRANSPDGGSAPTPAQSAHLELDLLSRDQEIMKEKTAKRTRTGAHYSYKTPEGKKESIPVIAHYYPKQIVYPFAKIDRHIDGKLMQAATIAQERAHAHSRSMCWHYVKEALLASGVIDSRPKSELAKEAAQDLVSNYGFKRLSVNDPFAAPVGSVLVYGANRAAGHVEIRTRDGFVSDFYSKTPSPRPLLGVYAKL